MFLNYRLSEVWVFFLLFSIFSSFINEHIILVRYKILLKRHLTVILLSFRSNPFYEPKPTPPPNNLINPIQELETEKRVKRKAPTPPVISPKMGGVNENTVVSAGKDLSTSPKVGVYS